MRIISSPEWHLLVKTMRCCSKHRKTLKSGPSVESFFYSNDWFQGQYHFINIFGPLDGRSEIAAIDWSATSISKWAKNCVEAGWCALNFDKCTTIKAGVGQTGDTLQASLQSHCSGFSMEMIVCHAQQALQRLCNDTLNSWFDMIYDTK